MSKVHKLFQASVLMVVATAGTAGYAQSSAATVPADAPPPPRAMSADDTSSYATGKPLTPESREGFWGHLNPLARKKWVKRQIDPVKDRVNELDQLQAKNAGDIRDVDTRSQAGIGKAMLAANTADGHARDAANRADAANTLAGSASSRTEALHGTVNGLDSYAEVSSAAVPFVAGRTTLGPKAKSELDELAAKLETEKGYIVEVQGYSKAGVQSSQAMADAVVRYLVTEHQVPLYRIYRTGLGRQKDAAVVNGVQVRLLHNSLAAMNAPRVGTANPPTDQ